MSHVNVAQKKTVAEETGERAAPSTDVAAGGKTASRREGKSFATVRRVVWHAWRLAAAAALFAAFGAGGLLLAFVVFPLLTLAVGSAEDTGRRCRHSVHLGFRLWVWAAEALGLLRCEVEHKERLGNLGNLEGRLVIANHPSLIDVVLLIAQLPNAHCVVKEGVWRNPFMGRVVRAAGYVPNMRADVVVDRVVELLQSGETVVLFPEGTRTPPGGKPVVRSGTATILLRSNLPATPVHLRMVPRALAKGDSLRTLPRCRIQYTMTVGEPIEAAMFATADASERANARAGAALLTRALGGGESNAVAS